jgi:DNA-directed RNA polymerase specialized sigma24 family protein
MTTAPRRAVHREERRVQRRPRRPPPCLNLYELDLGEHRSRRLIGRARGVEAFSLQMSPPSVQFRCPQGHPEENPPATDHVFRSSWLSSTSGRLAVLMLDRVTQRRRAAHLARHYRDQEGLAIAEIARRLGRAQATIKSYL